MSIGGRMSIMSISGRRNEHQRAPEAPSGRAVTGARATCAGRARMSITGALREPQRAISWRECNLGVRHHFCHFLCCSNVHLCTDPQRVTVVTSGLLLSFLARFGASKARRKSDKSDSFSRAEVATDRPASSKVLTSRLF